MAAVVALSAPRVSVSARRTLNCTTRVRLERTLANKPHSSFQKASMQKVAKSSYIGPTQSELAVVAAK